MNSLSKGLSQTLFKFFLDNYLFYSTISILFSTLLRHYTFSTLFLKFIHHLLPQALSTSRTAPIFVFVASCTSLSYTTLEVAIFCLEWGIVFVTGFRWSTNHLVSIPLLKKLRGPLMLHTWRWKVWKMALELWNSWADTVVSVLNIVEPIWYRWFSLHLFIIHLGNTYNVCVCVCVVWLSYFLTINHAGFIAMFATLASRDVVRTWSHFCMQPTSYDKSLWMLDDCVLSCLFLLLIIGISLFQSPFSSFHLSKE